VPPRVAILPPVPVPYREPLFRTLAERDRIDPHVVYLSGSQPGWDQPPGWFAAGEGYSSEILAGRQLSRPGRSPLTLPRGLGTALTRTDPACLISWEYGPATLRALAWCRRRGRPLVVFSELTPWGHAELGPAQRQLHGLLAGRVAGFIVASTQGVARLEALGVPRERVEVALQSADLEPLHLRSAAERRDGPVRVLSVGRLVPDKNPAGLIEAFAAAGFEPGEAELELRGTGPLEGELRRLAEALVVPVALPGPAAPAELPGIYAAADVLALVSSYEPFGVAMREGAAAGLPLICSKRAGAAGDVAVAGENALIVNPDSRDEIAGALRRMVREPALRERLAAGSVAITERHPLEADVAAWERAALAAIRGA
jgi:glycosyltransferase involved in cell wall biosynthesis